MEAMERRRVLLGSEREASPKDGKEGTQASQDNMTRGPT